MAWVAEDVRYGEDGASSITWSAACNTSVTGWDAATQLIVAAWFSSSDHSPGSKYVQLRWRNKTDNPTGSFANLVTGSGELRAGTSAGCITNADPVGSSSACQTSTYSEEIENESPLESQSFSPAKSEYIETQWCVDMSNAHVGDEYEFEIYDVGGAASLGIFANTVTTAASEIIQIGQAIMSQVGRDLVVNMKEKLAIAQATMAQVGQSLVVNMKEKIAIAQATMLQVGQSLTVLAAEIVQIAQATMSQVGQALTVKIQIIIQIAQAAMSQVGQTLKVNEVLKMGQATMSQVGQAVTANAREIVQVAAATMAQVGRTLKINEVLKLGAATLATVGRPLTVLTGEAAAAVKKKSLLLWYAIIRRR